MTRAKTTANPTPIPIPRPRPVDCFLTESEEAEAEAEVEVEVEVDAEESGAGVEVTLDFTFKVETIVSNLPTAEPEIPIVSARKTRFLDLERQQSLDVMFFPQHQLPSIQHCIMLTPPSETPPSYAYH